MLSREERTELEADYKIEPTATITQEMRSLYFKAIGHYGSDSDVHTWYYSLSKEKPTARGDGGSIS